MTLHQSWIRMRNACYRRQLRRFAQQ